MHALDTHAHAGIDAREATAAAPQCRTRALCSVDVGVQCNLPICEAQQVHALAEPKIGSINSSRGVGGGDTVSTQRLWAMRSALRSFSKLWPTCTQTGVRYDGGRHACVQTHTRAHARTSIVSCPTILNSAACASGRRLLQPAAGGLGARG
jgi:hypothetical protein